MATILVVDDSPSQRAALAAALIDAGHQILEAEDGTRAVELVREHGPELCFVDDVMPGPSGIRTIKALAEDPQTATVRCVYMQGRDDAVDRDWALRAGAVECLVRPVEPELALSVVARLVVDGGRPV